MPIKDSRPILISLAAKQSAEKRLQVADSRAQKQDYIYKRSKAPEYSPFVRPWYMGKILCYMKALILQRERAILLKKSDAMHGIQENAEEQQWPEFEMIMQEWQGSAQKE